MTRSFSFFLLALTLIGVFFLGFVTKPWGAGLSADSSGYIVSARSFLRGEGFREIPHWNGTAPMINFPPLQSILLAGIGLFGPDPVEGARALNLIFFGANLLLAGILIFHVTRSLLVSLAGTFLTLTSLVILEVHAMVWSEPPFLFFGFLGLFELALYLQGKRGPFFFFSAGAFLALAFLAKYSGVSFVAAALAGILLLERKSFSKRLAEVFMMGIVSCLPIALWLVRNRLAAGKSTELMWYFEPYLNVTLRKLLAYPSAWLLPESVPAVIRGGALALFLGFLATVGFVQWRKKEISILSQLALLLIASHVGIYIFTTVFMGEQPFDNRALSPVFIAFMIYASETCGRLWKESHRRSLIRTGLALLTLTLSFSYVVRAFKWGNQVRKEGLGYASREWKESQVIQGVRKLPSNIPIYTNGLDAVYLLANKPVSSIPAKENVLKVHVPDPERRAFKNYPDELERMTDELRANRGVVVYLNKIYWRWYYPSEKELVQRVPLQVLEKFDDGTLYKVKE